MALTMRRYGPNRFRDFRSTAALLLKVSWLVLLPLGMVLSVVLSSPTVEANEPQVDIVDSWVEDGYGFYVAFEATPTNASCSIMGEGLIEFAVDYSSPYGSSEIESVYGLAIWPSHEEYDATVMAQGKANGPQGWCLDSTPCRIQDIRVVKTWCPISEEPIWPRW